MARRGIMQVAWLLQHKYEDVATPTNTMHTHTYTRTHTPTNPRVSSASVSLCVRVPKCHSYNLNVIFIILCTSSVGQRLFHKLFQLFPLCFGDFKDLANYLAVPTDPISLSCRQHIKYYYLFSSSWADLLKKIEINCKSLRSLLWKSIFMWERIVGKGALGMVYLINIVVILLQFNNIEYKQVTRICNPKSNMPIYLSINQTVSLSVCLSIIRLFIQLSIYPSVKLFICLSVYLSINLSIYLSEYVYLPDFFNCLDLTD